ncbi:MAG: sulfatase activating formylglycine-generating enzyme [Myxococcota bacterium]|jgi:formylglycine-generating enzyme required for sulfatase activity
MGQQTDEDLTLTSDASGVAPAPLPPERPTDPLPLPTRYADLGAFAHGGTGVVHRAEDRELQRVVAVKVQHRHLVGHQRAKARFEAEAVMTAGLQHPGIVAIHDRGTLPDGRLWFAMKEVRGRTLDRVVAEVHSGGDWTLHRLLESFFQVCQTMAYAHTRGVVHRDLKPANLMIGEFGEVLVMDWGLARSLAAPEGEDDLAPVPATDGMTRDGDVLGTRGYMAPEQARGEHAGPTADVFALGAVLWHVLTGRKRPDADGARPWPDGVAPALRTLGSRALASDTADRFADAGRLADALRGFLDGAERSRRADSAVEAADALGPRVSAGLKEAAELRTRAAGLLARCRPHDPVSAKEPGWTLEDRADAVAREVAVHQTQRLQRLHAALNLVPDHAGAHARLAEHYRDRLLAAEAQGDALDAARSETLLAAHDRGQHTQFLRGEGTLALVTEPPADRVRLFRYVRRQRRLQAELVRELGPAPLDGVALAQGSYLLELHAAGHAVCRYPVWLGRGESWEGVAPGGVEPAVVRLPPAGSLDPEDCYVPPGWFWSGDPGAADGLPRRRLWVDGFVIRRHPVTNRGMLAFLNDLVTRGRGDEAEAWSPRERATAPGEPAPRPVYGRHPDGRFHLRTDELGFAWQPDWPVALVSFDAARAFAAWQAERTGLPWRLPHDLEWEKAARGVDGRRLPWGDFFDATWAQTAKSVDGTPVRAPVGQHPVDVSTYGVEGLCGNVRDWCANRYQRAGPPPGTLRVDPHEEGTGAYRLQRGGSWSSMPNLCWSGGRLVGGATMRMASVGFRLARSWPDRVS